MSKNIEIRGCFIANTDNRVYASAPDTNTKLLLHGDGANGSSTILDETGKVMTVYGGAQISNSSFKFGNGSLYIPTGANIAVNSSKDIVNTVSWQGATGVSVRGNSITKTASRRGTLRYFRSVEYVAYANKKRANNS